MIPTLIFYLFAFVLIASAVMVVFAKNPVHSVLFLVLCFFNASGLFLLIGAEYVAMTLIIVYVGAIAVLFLFVVMMLDISLVQVREGVLQYLPLGIAVGAILFTELFLMLGAWLNGGLPSAIANPIPPVDEISNTEAIGRLLYTDYLYLFQLAGLVLLVGMIGAITLTLRTRPGVRKQKVSEQLARRREDSVALVQVQSGEGV